MTPIGIYNLKRGGAQFELYSISKKIVLPQITPSFAKNIFAESKLIRSSYKHLKGTGPKATRKTQAHRSFYQT